MGCNNYCAAVGRTCTGAWEEDSDTCNVSYNLTCDQYIDSSDAICECKSEAEVLLSGTWDVTYSNGVSGTYVVNGSHVVISHGNGLSASSGSVHASDDPIWQGVIDYNDGQRIDNFNKISDEKIYGNHGKLHIHFTATLRAQATPTAAPAAPTACSNACDSITFAWSIKCGWTGRCDGCSGCVTVPTPTPTVCEDDPNWWDSEYGDGGSQCKSGPSGGVVANPDWCTDYGDYSTEARRACPLACGVCGQVVCAADEVSRRRSRPYTCAVWPELCSGTSVSDTEFRNTCQTTCRAALHCEADDGGYGGSYGGTNTSDDFCESLVNEYPESCNSESFRRECEQSCTAALTDGLLSAANQQLVPAVGALAAFFQIVISLRLE